MVSCALDFIVQGLITIYFIFTAFIGNLEGTKIGQVHKFCVWAVLE